MSLSKQHRLPLRTELRRIKKEGKIIQGKFFSLLLAKCHQPSRFAFIVSKKIHKRAVKRNRIRRLLAESVRSFLTNIKPDFDIVFLTKKAIVDQGFDQIKNEVEKIFKKAKLLES